MSGVVTQDLGNVLLKMLEEVFTGMLKDKGIPDLSARQLSAMLITYLETEKQTVRGLAARLKVNKPAITRAHDRLVEFRFIRRNKDPEDRRSVLISRTGEGARYMRQLRARLKDAFEASQHVSLSQSRRTRST